LRLLVSLESPHEGGVHGLGVQNFANPTIKEATLLLRYT